MGIPRVIIEGDSMILNNDLQRAGNLSRGPDGHIEAAASICGKVPIVGGLFHVVSQPTEWLIICQK